MENVFVQLAVILTLASVLGYVASRFNLPLIVAYLTGGLLIAAVQIFDVKTSQALSFLPEIGIAFVLFLVGMELDLREVRNLGRPIILAGTLQIIITSIAGYAVAQLLGFETMESWYLGIGLSFSSTIVVIKMLIDKKDLSSLYGKLSIGILLLEDLVAVILLLALTTSTSILNLGLSQAFPIMTLIIKGVLVFLVVWLLNRYFLPKLFRAISASAELLFLTALAWCFIYVSFALLLGFSVVIGAFLAGIALASSPYHFHIQGKIKPLREFFSTLFFVYLGTQVDFADLGRIYPAIIIFTLYALVVKPILFLLILGSFGFRKHTMFQTALNLSQISEFSLILLLVGLKLGVASSAALSTVALTGVLSIIISSIMVSNSNKLFLALSKIIGFFERKDDYYMEKTDGKAQKDHVVVIGAHRVGGEIVRFLKKEKIPQIVIDFNPKQVESLSKDGVHVIYGDMLDPEILDTLGLPEAKLVISTAPDVTDNKYLLEEIKNRHLSLPVVVRAETADDAKKLYKAGADFVIIPEVLAGDFLAEKLKEHLKNGNFFKDRSKIELAKLAHKPLAWE